MINQDKLQEEIVIMKKSIAKKYARYVHVGEKRALSEFPTVKAFLTKPGVQKELKLSEDEIKYLEKEVSISH